MEIEPDGQQFLNARKAETGSDLPPPPSPPAPEPSGGGGGSRTTIAVIAAIVAVVVVGGVLFLTLTGDSGERRELETGGDSEIELRERAEATTTTEPPETTTTEPPPTTTTTGAPVLPGDPAVPFPDPALFPGGVAPGVPPTTPTCPGGGISMTVGTSSYTSINGNTAKRVDIQGTAKNDTNAPVLLDLTLTITHDAGNHPNPWVAPVNVANATLAPGAMTTWTFSGVFEGASSANVSALGGGFRWADPAHASCPTQ